MSDPELPEKNPPATEPATGEAQPDSPLNDGYGETPTIDSEAAVSSAIEDTGTIDLVPGSDFQQDSGIAQQSQASPETEAAVDLAVQSRRSRMPSAAVGLLLASLGIILVWPMFSGGFRLVSAAIIAIIVAGIALSLMMHWLNSGRYARGALFLAFIGLFWSVLTGVFVLEAEQADIEAGWPLYIAALGGAILLTILGDKRRSKQLIAPGMFFSVAGLSGLLVTNQTLPESLLDTARQAGPWVLAFMLIGLIPLIVRKAPRHQ
jgi:hypothetical protein